MPHREHQYELLSAYLDGELTPPQARNLEEALADDAALRAELERLKRARDAVRTLPHQAAPAALAERVLGHIERGSVLEGANAPTERRSHWALHISAAAAAIVLVGLGLGAYLLLRQPSYLDRQLLAQKEALARLAVKSEIAPASAPQPELAPTPRDNDQVAFSAGNDRATVEAARGLIGPIMPAKGRPEQFGATAESQPTELAKAEQPADEGSLNQPQGLHGVEVPEPLRSRSGGPMADNQTTSRQAVAAKDVAESGDAMAYRVRDAAATRPEEVTSLLTPQGPPLYEPRQGGRGESMASPAVMGGPHPGSMGPTAGQAAAPAAAAPAKSAAFSLGAPRAASVQTTKGPSAMAETRPAVYFDLAVPDLRLVIRVKNLAAAQEHMRPVLVGATPAHGAAAAADLGGIMCVSFNGRIVRQDGAIQYEFRIHPRAMPLLVRALTEMESQEQSWQVLQSPRPLESKWQVLRECLGEAMDATQPVRDRVVISRQELPTTRGAADSIEMIRSYSLVNAAATATAPSGPGGPPPAATPPATRPAQQWVEPYNLIVRIEAFSAAADNAATHLAPATSATTAASRPAP